MKPGAFLFFFVIIILSCKTQKDQNTESIKERFLKEQEVLGLPIFKYLNDNFYPLHCLNQSDFTHKIDSFKTIYTTHLNQYKGILDNKTYQFEDLAINSTFDKYILEYPQHHEHFTGEKITLSNRNLSKLKQLLPHFNHENKLSNEYFLSYVNSYISIASEKKLKSGVYNDSDNQQLASDWSSIESLFENPKVVDYWKHKYLTNHIDNYGIKNIDNFYENYIKSSPKVENVTQIKKQYSSAENARALHQIEIYKKVNNFELDMHLFLPDPNVFKGNRPTIVYFHGGSWSAGKPDWFFETGKEYSKKGWVAAAAEYRIKGRHGTYPFEAVKDAKSAIRWLRENAKKYNIDPNKLVATGNSAGGHLCIATTLVDKWNENSDNLAINPIPNVVIVNAGVYDLTVNNTKWITEYNQNKNLVREISPTHLTRKTETKFLLIHGENDKNCTYSSAQDFYTKMKSLDNEIEMHTIQGASHRIWYGKHHQEVAQITHEYIQKLNIE